MSKLVLAGTLAIYWVYGQPLSYAGGELDAVNQAMVCKRDNHRQAELYQAWDCMLIGPPIGSLIDCYGEAMAMAEADFPEHIVRFCVPLRLSDLERLKPLTW